VTRALYVVKVGSATLAHPGIFTEIAALTARARVLVVAGGAAGIAEHYARIGREIPRLQLPNGDEVRYCPPEEMAHLVAAYDSVTLPAVRTALQAAGCSAFCTTAAAASLVHGTPNRPLKTVRDGRVRLVRDHRAGTVSRVDTTALEALLTAFDVVVLSPPVSGDDGGGPLNVDADVLAAELATALQADHLRLVTGTAGVLTDPAVPDSTLPDALHGEAAAYAGGRMRQKVRAAELAMTGTADIAVTGPHALDSAARTRFWREEPPSPDLRLLTEAAQIPSVSGDEGELARHLVRRARELGLSAEVDEVGNFVATRGSGPRRLLLLGHLDTVPFHWPVCWKDGELHGRGTVDAKGSLVNFLETLAEVDVPAGAQVRVVGAVEEEISSSKGAFHVRDHYPADAVVIGEPSGSRALTLGYFGLLKFRISVWRPAGHSAGRDALSAPDALMGALGDVRAAVLGGCPEMLSAVIDIRCEARPDGQRATGILNFRVPPGADLDAARDAALARADEHTEITVERCTPGHSGGRATTLAKAFAKGFAAHGVRPRYLVKKGTSDMNTLATTWRGVPMVAYGPGDSALDHTDVERLPAADYRLARKVLADTVRAWLVLEGGAR
jgi:LysW-gamma-L-lysine carboxypeptidase